MGNRIGPVAKIGQATREVSLLISQPWLYWALLSAVFASLTAIFAKVGLHGVDSDFATLVRTVIILFAIIWFVVLTNKWSSPFALSGKTWTFLTLSGLATGFVGLLLPRAANGRGCEGRPGR